MSDNLERAVQAAQQARATCNRSSRACAWCSRFFEDALERLGVERVPSVGQPFDPGLHEAVQQVESDEPAGTVVIEMVPGYRLGGKLLRAAMVAVAQGARHSRATVTAAGAVDAQWCASTRRRTELTRTLSDAASSLERALSALKQLT